MFFKQIHDVFVNNLDKIASAANHRAYENIVSYKNNRVSETESYEATKFLILKTAEALIREASTDDASEVFLKELISFNNGIATKRVDYKVDLVDLMASVNIVREELWNAIEQCDVELESLRQLFILERKLNSFMDSFLIDLAGKFLAVRDELIESQTNSLKMWEEVVKSTSHLDLKIPCRGEFVVIARVQAEAIARRLNLSDSEVDDLVLAIGEICDNAIEHGASPRGVEIHYYITMEELIVEIIDFGKGFDPTGKGEAPPELLSERGRGIFITKQLVDNVSIESHVGEGTKVTIRKNRVFK